MDITGAAGSSRLRFLYGGGPSTGTNTLTEALNIVLEGSSAGNVGIGTSSPLEKLHVQLPTGTNGDIVALSRSGGAYRFHLGLDGNSNFYVSNNSDEKILNVNYTGEVGIGNTVASTVSGGYTNLVVGSGSASDSGISIYNNTTGTGRIHFADGTTVGDRYDGFIAYKHNDRELLIGAGTAGSTVAYFSQHGFHPNPSDQGSSTAANALDDYEEGTFSPFTASQISTYGITIPAQAHYIKIGRICQIWFRFLFTNTSSSAGMTINLPFTGSNPTTSASYSPFFITVHPKGGTSQDMHFLYNGGNDATGTFYKGNSNYAGLTWDAGSAEYTVIGAYRTT